MNEQPTKQGNRRGWPSELHRLGRALAVVSLALLLSRCGSSDGLQGEPDGRGAGPQVSRGAERPAQGESGAEPPTIVDGYIIPRMPNANSRFAVEVRVVDPLGKAVTLEHQWFLNGHSIDGATEPTLPPGEFVRGDAVSVEVTPVAGGRVGPVWRAPQVEIGNSPPRVLRLTIEPSPATRREPLRAVATVDDPDGDAVTLAYQWFRNGTLIPEATHATLDPSHYERRDLLSVEIVATDGVDSTHSLRSPEVDVLPAAPKFVSQVGPADWKDGRFRYQARAEQPDGGELRYRLSGDAPQGMRVDPDSGLVEWEPQPSQTGTFAFQVIVEDSEGAGVAQPISLTIESQERATGKE